MFVLLASSPNTDAKDGIGRVLVGTMLDRLIQEGRWGAANLGKRFPGELGQCNVVDEADCRWGRCEWKGSNFLQGKEGVLGATSDA